MRKYFVCTRVVMLVCSVLFCAMTVEAAFSFKMPSLWYKKRIEDIDAILAEEKYDEAYYMYLERIPPFNPYAKRCEALFYRYVRVCIETGRFDEAEGYLYQMRTKKKVFDFPADYDYYWAVLCDRRGLLEKAYAKYHFFVTLYPEDPRIASARFRLAQLALRRGLFSFSQRQFISVVADAPSSDEAQRVQEMDDDSLKGYMIAFDIYVSEEEAIERMNVLQKKSLMAVVHKAYREDVLSYIVGVGVHPRFEEAQRMRDEYAEAGYSVSIYPEPLGSEAAHV